MIDLPTPIQISMPTQNLCASSSAAPLTASPSRVSRDNAFTMLSGYAGGHFLASDWLGGTALFCTEIVRRQSARPQTARHKLIRSPRRRFRQARSGTRVPASTGWRVLA